MQPYRAAVIGCGLIGSRFQSDAARIGIYTHAGAYEACPRTELVALCDGDPRALAEAGAQWNIPCLHDSVERLLAEVQPEIVSICTPDGNHAEMLTQVLSSPGVKAVVAEKPLALSADEARRALALARGRPVLVNYFRRFTDNHRALKASLVAGALGRIFKVQGVYTKGLFHNGTHWLDLARWLVGEITEVQAHDSLGESGPDPTLDLRLMFESGAVGTLAAMPHTAYSIFEMDILGEAGRARLVDGGWIIETSRPGPSPRYSGYTVLGEAARLPGDLRDATLKGVANLASHLDDARVPLACSGQDGLQSLVIAEAARRSLAQPRPIAVPPPLLS